MNNKKYKASIIFTIIPIAIFICSIICLLAGIVLEKPTERGMVYTLFMLTFICGLILGPIVSFISSIVGIVFASMASKEQGLKTVWLFILDGIELVASLVFIGIAVLLIVGGASV